MNFLSKPFTPGNKVKKIIISCDCPSDIITNLEKNNIEIVKTLKNPNLCDGLSGHADLQINVIKDFIITADFTYEYYKMLLPEFNVIKGQSDVISKYPNDIAYNASVINKHLVHNTKFTDKVLLDLYLKNGYKTLNVRQGYTKCTTCIISENAVITEDHGIAKKLMEIGVDVLLVSQGDVTLNGFNNGFLGGASGLIDKNKLAICGNIQKHNDCKSILKFANKHDVEIISLSDDNIVDIGSIIPVLEE